MKPDNPPRLSDREYMECVKDALDGRLTEREARLFAEVIDLRAENAELRKDRHPSGVKP